MATSGGRILIGLLDAGVIGLLLAVDGLRRRWPRRSMAPASPNGTFPTQRPAVVDLTEAEARDAACRS